MFPLVESKGEYTRKEGGNKSEEKNFSIDIKPCDDYGSIDGMRREE